MMVGWVGYFVLGRVGEWGRKERGGSKKRKMGVDGGDDVKV